MASLFSQPIRSEAPVTISDEKVREYLNLLAAADRYGGEFYHISMNRALFHSGYELVKMTLRCLDDMTEYNANASGKTLVQTLIKGSLLRGIDPNLFIGEFSSMTRDVRRGTFWKDAYSEGMDFRENVTTKFFTSLLEEFESCKTRDAELWGIEIRKFKVKNRAEKKDWPDEPLEELLDAANEDDDQVEYFLNSLIGTKSLHYAECSPEFLAGSKALRDAWIDACDDTQSGEISDYAFLTKEDLVRGARNRYISNERLYRAVVLIQTDIQIKGIREVQDRFEDANISEFAGDMNEAIRHNEVLLKCLAFFAHLLDGLNEDDLNN